MNLLIGEFVNDITTLQTERAVNSRQEVLWSLIDSLVNAFESPIPTDHLLFKNCKELTPASCIKLIESYNLEKERLMQIYQQEVLHIETVNTKGRRAKGIVATKVKDLQEVGRVNKRQNQSESTIPIILQSTPLENPIAIPITSHNTSQCISSESQIASTIINDERPIKRTRHLSTVEEKEILTPYLANPNPTDNNTNLVLTALLQISNHWNKKKVRDAWHNNKKKINKNNNNNAIL